VGWRTRLGRHLRSDRAAGVDEHGAVFRSGIPGIVAWDLGITGPFAQVGSVRGSSSFSSNYLKTYVDGVELASPYLLFAIDPFSVERVEIIRVRRARRCMARTRSAAWCRSSRRKGSPAAHWRPQIDAALVRGRMESKFVDGGSAVQRHSGMLFTGGGTSSLGGRRHVRECGAIAPGATLATAVLRRRTHLHSVPAARRDDAIRRRALHGAGQPLFRAAGCAGGDPSLLESQRIENETYGVTADFQPRPWWRQTLVVGIDRTPDRSHHSASQPLSPTHSSAPLANGQQDVARYSMAVRLLSLPMHR
jgi:hypothetical protein